jgi:hypothetical protein
MSDAGQRAEDRWLISDTLSKYGWGYDEGDFELLAEALTEDATVTGTVHGTTIGWGPTVGRSEIVKVLSDIRLGQHDQRRHGLASILFDELTTDTARVRCYQILFATENGAARFVASGWYRFTLVKDGDVWRIKEQVAQLDSPF